MAEPSLDELVGVEPAALGRDELGGLLRAMGEARARLDAAELAALAAFDALDGPVFDAAVGPGPWLTHHTGVLRHSARQRARLAGLVGVMAGAVKALGDGAITFDHVRVLARCVGGRTREQYVVDEEVLVDHARSLGADDLAKVVTYWLAHADPDGASPDPDTSDTVFMSETMAGRWIMRGDFGHLGAEIAAALQEKYQELWRADRAAAEIDPADPIAHRTPAQRRAAALAELIGLGGAADDEMVDRRRPAFSALVDQHTATGHRRHTEGVAGFDPGGVFHETDTGSVLPPDALAAYLCDCNITRVVLDPASVPLDVGRTARTVTPAQRRALIARNKGQGCDIGGCGRPPRWCDAHHIVPWSEGGATDLSNLVLLCRHHHRRLHAGHLTVKIIDGRPRFWRGDGTPITSRSRGSPGPAP